MSTHKKAPITLKALSVSLVAALIVAAPGPLATKAFAVVIRARITPVATVPGSVGSAALGTLKPAAGGMNLNLANPLSQGLPSVGVLPTQTIGAGSSYKTISPSGVAPISPLRSVGIKKAADASGDQISARSAAPGVAPTARQALSSGVEKINKAKGSFGRFASLKSLFTGSRKHSGTGAVFASQDFGEAASQPIPGLSKLSPADLEAVAVDSTNGQKEREAAVFALAQQGESEALVRISKANPEGGATDYEIHRAALKSLAIDFGEVRSLRPISISHSDEILEDLKKNKPAMVITDYDDTLKPFKEPLTAEDGARIAAVSDAGVKPVILTDRPAIKKRESDVGVLDSVSKLSPAQKAGLTVISDKSLKSTTFDAETGAPNTTEGEKVAWTEEEYAALEAAKDVILAKVETIEYGDPAVRFSLYDSGLAIFLKLQMPAEQVEAAALLLKEELAKRGVTGYNVVGRTPATHPEENPPYLSVSKIDKSVGVKRILRESGIKSSDILILGDQFMTQGAGRATDEYMLDGAPGARVLAVGPTADPRLPGVLLWNTKGEQATTAILEALGTKAPASEVDDKVNVKGVAGLLITAAISIFAFAFVLIAMPVMVDQVAGAGALANVFALGTAASILLAYVTGKMIDLFTLRQTTLINSWMRILTLAAHFVFPLLGIMNFWTLSFLVMMDLWLLTSIVATSQALVPFLVGGNRERNTTMGSVNWLIFAGLNVFVGLVLGGGQIVDSIGWQNVYGIAALVNLALIPITWFTIPNIYTKAGKKFKSIYRVVADGLQSLKERWRSPKKSRTSPRKAPWKLIGWAGAMAVGLGLFSVFNTVLPLAAVLASWTLTTPGFKRIMANPTLRASVPFILLSGMVVYPLRNVYIPLIAKAMLPVGAEIGLLIGQLSGGLFLGMMMASVALLKLPGKWGPIIQAAFGAGFAAMMYYLVMPGSIPALLGGLAFYAALLAVAKRIPNWGWIAANLIGLPLIWLTLPAWGAISLTVLILGLVGLIHNNTPLILNGRFYGTGYSDDNIRPHMGQVTATMGALFNAALAFGYALAHSVAPTAAAFPAALSTIAWIFTAAAILFVPALFLIPGLNPFKKDSNKK